MKSKKKAVEVIGTIDSSKSGDTKLDIYNNGGCLSLGMDIDGLYGEVYISNKDEEKLRKTLNDRHKSLNTFTQEMKDSGVFPSVGMEFISIEFGKPVNSIIKVITDEFIIYTFANGKSGECCIEICANLHKPLTTPITLIDGKAYQFEYELNTIIGVYSESQQSFDNYGRKLYPWHCTNIQPLTVEKSK
tara:strand:+ start:755 stop:1321 length:567 start_codon:yes stop_codon:yes gene_type:complete